MRMVLKVCRAATTTAAFLSVIPPDSCRNASREQTSTDPNSFSRFMPKLSSESWLASLPALLAVCVGLVVSGSLVFLLAAFSGGAAANAGQPGFLTTYLVHCIIAYSVYLLGIFYLFVSRRRACSIALAWLPFGMLQLLPVWSGLLQRFHD